MTTASSGTHKDVEDLREHPRIEPATTARGSDWPTFRTGPTHTAGVEPSLVAETTIRPGSFQVTRDLASVGGSTRTAIARKYRSPMPVRSNSDILVAIVAGLACAAPPAVARDLVAVSGGPGPS